MSSNKNIIFCDGASKGNPGPGGWGAVVSFGGLVQELGGGEENTTNNRMEIKAAIEALKKTEKDSEILVCTDSRYLINGATKWLAGWQENGWITKTKEPVLNKDLWEELALLLSGRKITWSYVGGHIGIPGNERVDEIASVFASGGKPELFFGLKTKYKIDLAEVSHSEAKKSSKSRSRAEAYSYVSAIDGRVLVHKTWAECEARVKGKSGARFKKSLSKEDEDNLVREFGGKI